MVFEHVVEEAVVMVCVLTGAFAALNGDGVDRQVSSENGPSDTRPFIITP